MTQSAACSSLLPDEWKKAVQAPPLPDGETVGDYVAFADATLGKLDIVNDRLLSALGIVSRCEARDAAAVKKAGRGFFGRLLGG